MNKAQRVPWLERAEKEYKGWLCPLCRYLKAYYEDATECTHPLTERFCGFEREPGDDCWGFRPLKGE